jgi:[acyl-carrier-protein] S-malonyltransferase
MEPARQELYDAIVATHFNNPTCPVYQNVDALPYIDPGLIKENLINQLTSPVRWTQSVQNMVNHGATHFTEVGPGSVLQGLVKKIAREAVTDGIN